MPRINRYNRLPFEDLGGGVDEGSPPKKAKFRVCKNVRDSEGGTSKVKRPGLTKLDSVYDFGTKNVYGCFGIGELEEIEILACLEDDIQLKREGAWSSIFSPTKTIEKPVSFVKEKGLTLIAGYEKPITVKEGSAFYSGIEAPPTLMTGVAQAGSSGISIIEHLTSNQDHCGELRSLAANTLLAQSFKLDSANEASSVKLKMKKINSPTGNIWVEIHSSQAGTSATKDASTNIVGEASDNVDVSTLTTAFTTITFAFSGTKPSLSADTTYYLVVYGSYAVSSTNFAVVGYDSSSPSYSDGKYWEINGSFAWSSHEGYVDLVFEIYGEAAASGEVESYGAVETGDCFSLRNHATARRLLAQSFQVDSASDLSSIKLALRKKCLWDVYHWLCPEGDVWVEIHSSIVGTSATKNASTNIVGEASDNIDVDDIGKNDFDWEEFNFTGVQPSLTAATTYYIVLYCDYSVKSDRYIKWACSGDYYSDGQAYTVDSSMSWSSESSYDFSFIIYGTYTDTGVIESYDFDYLDTIYELRENAATTLMAQEFEAIDDSTLYSVKLYLSKLGAPADNVWVEIHSAQGGTSTTKDASTAIVGTASDDVAIAGIDTFPTYAQHEFVFNGTQPVLTSGNTYYLVVYASYSVSATVHVKVGMDRISPGFGGGSCWDLDGSLDWTELPNVDLLFEIYSTSDLGAGDYSYRVTFYRGGNYPCESNPSEPTEDITATAGQEIVLSNIPVSSESEVTARRIYRTQADLAVYYWLVDIEDNSTTTFTDNLADASLGDEVSYESYPPPEGEDFEVWDGKLWVTRVADHPEALFYSRTGKLEQFPSPATSFFPLREDETDEVMKVVEFRNNLYPVKVNSIWIVTRSGEDYLTDKIVRHTGTSAKGSVVATDRGIIMLTNHYKIGICDGWKMIPSRDLKRINRMVKDTLASINTSYAYRSTAQHDPDNKIYYLSIPTGTNKTPDTTIAFCYAEGEEKLFIDTYHQHITSISLTDIDQYQRELLLGTKDGEVYKLDTSATTDDGRIIISKFRTGLIGSEHWKRLRRMFLEYYVPTNKTLDLKIFRNVKETASLDKECEGATPSGENTDLRQFIHRQIKLGIPGRYFSLEFSNDEDTSAWEVMSFILYARSRGGRRTITPS